MAGELSQPVAHGVRGPPRRGEGRTGRDRRQHGPATRPHLESMAPESREGITGGNSFAVTRKENPGHALVLVLSGTGAQPGSNCVWLNLAQNRPRSKLAPRSLMKLAASARPSGCPCPRSSPPTGNCSACWPGLHLSGSSLGSNTSRQSTASFLARSAVKELC